LISKSEIDTYFSRFRRIWDDDNKMGLHSIGLEDVDWIYLAQDRNKWCPFVDVLINLRVLYTCVKFLD
jgi:cyclopropane fatty-acyl-phospholipid synthase-like methyltransferase